MSHTPYVQSRLTEAQHLRTLASQISGYVDRRYGAFGHVNTSEADSLRRQALDIEASVLIPFKQIPVFDFSVWDCTHALNASQRARALTNPNPRLRAAAEAIYGGGLTSSLWPPLPIHRPRA